MAENIKQHTDRICTNCNDGSLSECQQGFPPVNPSEPPRPRCRPPEEECRSRGCIE
jgi:hypothetical protein